MEVVMFQRCSVIFGCVLFLGTFPLTVEATAPAEIQEREAKATIASATAASKSSPAAQGVDTQQTAPPATGGKQAVKPASFLEPVVDAVPQKDPGYGPQAVARPSTSTPLKAPPKSKQTPSEPKVILSQAHANVCRKHVGDLFPKMVLKNLAGNDTELSKWYGERLTLVVFWATNHVYATEQFRRLTDEVALPFAGTGVGVVAIHVGATSGEVSDLQKLSGGQFASLVDPEGKQFAQVADAKLPRSYLLDAQGHIVWMDIEYSRSTRRELANAIHFYLQKAAKAKQ